MLLLVYYAAPFNPHFVSNFGLCSQYVGLLLISTTFTDRLQNDSEENIQTIPTIGFNVEVLQYKNIKFQVLEEERITLTLSRNLFSQNEFN